MADWRNVGNWHWKERNCLEWAKKYLEDKLTGIQVSKDGLHGEVTSVDSITGDVDLNIRKGRLIAIYDVEIKLSWKATKGDDELEGKITIPEVAHDTDDYVYDITASSSAVAKLPLKDFIRKQLTPEITAKLEGFTEDLKQANGSDMYIPDKSGASTPVAAAKATTGEKASGETKQGNAVAVAANDAVSVAVTKDAKFSTRVSIWTRGPAEIQPKENTSFKLFNGHIEGQFTKLVPAKGIEMTWRVATWPQGHFSKVKISIEQQSTSTRLTLKQSGVPFNDEDATKANWDRYYWNSIKGSFGMGM
ncbi:activator of Hsp90 ATPase [Kickxella alabastrina]|uniref:activator of Hsp90 ATPase n=1 Tax=Kickxella alabastrina TaxID=61397 RepID=UPI00221EAC68|nr:activator of Hsp90 ATPase [Kickxella alabastrina]KAI7830107.1 activator of Hsp90 ATPase [Kickxella alabastrina]